MEFVNSSWYVTHKSFKDPLMDYGWLAKLACKWDMELLPAPNDEELASLIEMRNQFTILLDKCTHNGKLSKADIDFVNKHMAVTSFHRKLKANEDSIKLYDIPEHYNWSWFMSEAAASLSQLYTSEAVNSLKKCQNPGCGWFFIDESKGRNRKWCDDTCATLMKVRRFREKQKGSDNIS